MKRKRLTKFTHLHLHTEYSLLDGANKIKELARRLKELGMDAVAMTDHGNMFGAIDFYKVMKREGIKPIIGMEAYIHNSNSLRDKSTKQRFHLCLYAKDEIGYKNLMYLSSKAYIDGFYYYPRINKKLLEERSEGLICSSACLQGEINWHLNMSERNIKFGAKGYEKAKEIALWYRDTFGEDFYLELMRHGISNQLSIDKEIIRLSLETGIKIVATNDTHYTNRKDANAHEAFMCIAMNKTFNDPKRLKHSVHEFYLKSPEETATLFADIPEALKNTQEIVDKCNLEIKLGNPTPPNFKFTKDRAESINLKLPEPRETYSLQNDKVLFEYEVKKGFEKRIKDVPKDKHKEYRDRLEREIEIINRMKFPGYMLIVWDFVRVAKEMGIPVGPGRGCLTKEAKVYRFKRGLFKSVNIDKIEVGDLVLSHKNRLRRVTKLFKYRVEEELLNISTLYGDEINGITLTKEHKLFDGDGNWVEAQKIKKGDWLTIPIPKYRVERVKSFNLSNFTKRDKAHYHLINPYLYKKNGLCDIQRREMKGVVKREFLSIDGWRSDIDRLNCNCRVVKDRLKNSLYFRKFIGRWMVGGYIDGESLYTIFVGEKRREIDETLEFIYENDYDYSITKKGSISTVEVRDRTLSLFFDKIFHKDKSSKSLNLDGYKRDYRAFPKFIFHLPKDEILDILDGYISLRGYIDVDGGEIELSISSKRFATEMRELLFTIGVPSSIKRGRDGLYLITIPSDGSIYKIPKFRKGLYKIEKDSIKLKVKRVKKVSKKLREVYDFRVEDDHSYTTTNYTVHNSAAGSLVAYSLEITDIDPLPYGLLFERFLNPERVSMPDIDIDFCQARRQEIIDYVVNRYGRYNVAQIVTFGKLLAKGVIRDVARVMEMPYKDANNFAKLIPDKAKNLQEAYEMETKIKELLNKSPKAKEVWEFALLLEGLKRNVGTHAAGVVISNDELWHKTPLFKPSGQESFATQYDGKHIEDVDLIKFDFLGLKTLTVIKESLDLIEKRYGKKIDLKKVDMNDQKVYRYISSGYTLGLFQIESGGMKALAKKLKPSSFEDIIAMVALYRPGPMESGMVNDFVERKHGRAKITYIFSELEPILKPTYGVIVYQEQVIQIVQTIGGFSLGKADLVRRAMGKKIKEEMDRLKDQFADGAESRGFDREKALELFDLIVKFAGYGFNKSHSAAYAVLTFYTSYLKYYYPTEFMAAQLTLDKDNTTKVVRYVDELKDMNIELLPPDINRSDLGFIADEVRGRASVIFGLGAIKGVGDVAINSILEERGEGGFEDLSDFVSKIDSSKVNRKVIESLIKAGALDSFGFSRKAMLSQIDNIMESASKVAQAKKMAINSLFGDGEEMIKVNIELEEMREFDHLEILELEKESLGFYVSGHPLDKYKEQLSKIDYTLSSEIEELANGSEALFVGIIENLQEKVSKRGKRFGVATLMDMHGTIDLTLFDKQLARLEAFDLERPIAFKVKIQRDDRFTHLNILKIESLGEAETEKVKIERVEKSLETPEPIVVSIDLLPKSGIIEELLSLTEKYSGSRPLELHIQSKNFDVIIESQIYVSETILKHLGELKGCKSK